MTVDRKSDQMLLENHSERKDRDVDEKKSPSSCGQEKSYDHPGQQRKNRGQICKEEKVLKSEIDTFAHACSLEHLLDFNFSHIGGVCNDSVADGDECINGKDRERYYHLSV